ncbi:MAG TPA: universal stress protein [Wenzhouxiangella sp.]
MPSPTPTEQLHHCLVGVDGSTLSQQAFCHALDMVSHAGGMISAVAVIHSPAIVLADPQDRQALIEAERLRLSACLADCVSNFSSKTASMPNDIQLHTEILEGEPVATLLAFAKQKCVNHIVLGHRSKGPIETLLMGSVAKGIVDAAACTVTVVR